MILCTGGCGRVFPFTTNAAIKTGDGMALAYRAGAPLKDMEFVQYHPTGLPVHRHPDHRGRARRGRLSDQQGRLPLPAGLQPRQAAAAAGAAVSMELGPRDRLSQAFVKELEKGRTIETPYGHVVHLDLRHLGEKKINAQDPVRARAVPEVPEHRSGHGADPGAAGRPLHDGRRPHRHQRRDAAARPVRRRRGRLRQHQRRQPARVELAAGAAGVRRARRPGRGRVRVERPRASTPRVIAQTTDEQRRLEHDLLQQDSGRERIADLREEMQKTMEDERRHLPDRRVAGRRAWTTLRGLQERSANVAIEDHSQTFNTERIAALELAFMLDVAEAIVNAALRREESRGAHQRTDFPRATTSGSSRTRWSTATRTVRSASSTCRSRSPAGRRASGSRGG